jgi:hypothetical protein
MFICIFVFVGFVIADRYCLTEAKSELDISLLGYGLIALGDKLRDRNTF